jgi:hypothetical protein
MVVDLLDALSPGDWLCRYQVLFNLHLVVLVQTIYSKPGPFVLSSDEGMLNAIFFGVHKAFCFGLL